jgi:hypothetical protein
VESDLSRAGVDKIERNKPADSLSVLRFNDEVGHCLGDGVNNHANHLAADPIRTVGVRSNRESGLLCHATFPVP